MEFHFDSGMITRTRETRRILDVRTRSIFRARKSHFSLLARRLRARAISARVLHLMRTLRERALLARSQESLARSPLWILAIMFNVSQLKEKTFSTISISIKPIITANHFFVLRLLSVISCNNRYLAIATANNRIYRN